MLRNPFRLIAIITLCCVLALSTNLFAQQIEQIDALNNATLTSPIDAKFSIDDKRTQLFLSIALTLPIIFYFWYRRKIRYTIVCIAMSAFIYEVQLESILDEERKTFQQQLVENQLSTIANHLQLRIQNNLSMISGFAAYISAMPNLTQADFDRYAKALLAKSTMASHFASAKDLVINFVYPIEGNEQLPGLDYRERADQIGIILQIIKTQEIQMIGPINLVQGGVAFIGRAPIFTNKGKFWGIISSPLHAEMLFSEFESTGVKHTLDIAIKSFDHFGNELSMVYGDKKLFELENSSRFSIDVGAGKWVLTAIKSQLSVKLPINILSLRIYFTLAAVLFSLFSWYRFKQEDEKINFREKLKNDNSLFKSIGEVARIGGWQVNKDLSIQAWSDQSTLQLGEWIGYQPTAVQDFKSIVSEDDYHLLKSSVKNALFKNEPFDITFKLEISNGSPIWINTISDGKKSKGSSHIVGTLQDVTERVLNKKLIEHQATYDSLTGLPNRLFYNDRLAKAIEYAERTQQTVAVLYVDLDRFKPVNDNYGHQAGDKLLIEAATRIKDSIRVSDTVSRLSGDEFAVILNNIPKYSQVLKIAEEIQEQMQQPFEIENKAVHLSSSIGIALYPNDAHSADELLRKADQAMYEVKANGRNGCQFYTKEMQLKSEYRHDLLNELILAIDQDKLVPYYQPIIDLTTGTISKCEVLARWKKDNGDYVSPVEFISLAEESGLINKIDLYMLEKSCSSIASVAYPIELSINISPRLFQTKDRALEIWIDSIKKLSKSTQITVEITERLLTDDSDKALTILNQLSTYGVKIAIDDFGTGYSSLGYLIKYPVDIIKIDRSFVKEIGQDESAEALIETILAMAQRLEIQVVAEGIETTEQLEYLKNNGCDFGQGYYLGRPVCEADFSAFVDENIF